MRAFDYPITPNLLKLFVLRGIESCGNCESYSDAVGVSRGTIANVLSMNSRLRPVTVAKIVAFELSKNAEKEGGLNE